MSLPLWHGSVAADLCGSDVTGGESESSGSTTQTVGLKATMMLATNDELKVKEDQIKGGIRRLNEEWYGLEKNKNRGEI